MTANEQSNGRTFKIGTNHPICFHHRELLIKWLAAALAGSVGWGDHDSIAAASPFERDRFLDLSVKLCGMPIEDGSLADVIQDALKSVRRDHPGLHSFLNMSLMDARRRNASALRLRFSQSFASRLQRPSHAKVLSTTQRFGKTTKPLA